MGKISEWKVRLAAFRDIPENKGETYYHKYQLSFQTISEKIKRKGSIFIYKINQKKNEKYSECYDCILQLAEIVPHLAIEIENHVNSSISLSFIREILSRKVRFLYLPQKNLSLDDIERLAVVT